MTHDRYDSFKEYAQSFIDDFTDVCNCCGDCLDVCPAFPYTQFFSQGTEKAREKILEYATTGKQVAEVAEFIRSCYYCGQCAEVCPQGLNPYRFNDLIRPKLKDSGYLTDGRPWDGPYKFLPDTEYNFMKTLAAIQTSPSEKRWLTKIPEDPQAADLVFFPSCGEVAFPDRLFAKIDLLEQIGTEFVTIGPYENNACCGVGMVLAGSYEKAEARVRHLLDLLERFNPNTVIVGCPGTYRWIRDIVPYFRPYTFKFQHYFGFLSENIGCLDLKPINTKVTVHDACKLSRGGIDESDCPRTILNAIPGVEVIEMEHSRSRTICCGEDLPNSLSDLARDIRQQRLKEAIACGADVLTTVCPACDHNLAREITHYPIQIRNVLSLVIEAARIKEYENKIERFRSYNDIERVLQECRDTIEQNGYSPEELREPLTHYL